MDKTPGELYKERLKRIEDAKGTQFDISKKSAFRVPLGGPEPRVVARRTMLVGDAAGMINPIFYGGIRLAMLSGKIAGEVAAENLRKIDNNLPTSYKEYETRLKNYEFMKKVNLKCHHYFYNFSNKSLSKIGEIFNNRYINRIEKLEKLEIFWKIIQKPSLSKKVLALYTMYKGFKIARDWGF